MALRATPENEKVFPIDWISIDCNIGGGGEMTVAFWWQHPGGQSGLADA